MSKIKVNKNNVAMSPTPTQVKVEVGVDLFVALQSVSLGRKIHKLEWKDKEFYGILKDGVLQLHKPDGKFYLWVLSDADLLGEDYIIL